MYTLLKEDENTTKVMVVGYSVLNIFVESGTTNQPEKDDVASTVRQNVYVCMYCIHGSFNGQGFVEVSLLMFTN